MNRTKLTLSLGFTLIEFMVVVTIIALLGLAALTAVLPMLARGRDGSRKGDLVKISHALEDYYDAHDGYPLPSEISSCGTNVPTALENYLNEMPCDVRTGKPYLYNTDGVTCTTTCKGYRLMTSLEYEKDPDIKRLGCTKTFGTKIGCHQDGSFVVYNYGVSSGRLLVDD